MMPSKFVASCKQELKVRNCGFAHLPAEEFVKSQVRSEIQYQDADADELS